MKRRAAVIILLALLLANPADLSSCGPFFPTAVFVNAKAPDDERSFYGGNLGILRPTLQRRYLVMAYRMLSGQPLSKSQIDAVVDLERYRSSDIDKEVNLWLAARLQVPDAEPLSSIDTYKLTDYFIEIPNCGADAFINARKTLAEIIRAAAKASKEVRDWLHAQDMVFHDCGANGGNIPESANPGSIERVFANREYQIAAAYFYSGDYEHARAQWNKIAADAHSPWQIWAPYLIARSYLRENKPQEASAQLKQVLADPKEASIHRQAESLLDYARGRIDPAARLIDLSNQLIQKEPADLGHDLNDYTFLFDRLEGGSASDFDPNRTSNQMQVAADSRIDRLTSAVYKSDLSAWVAEYQNLLARKHDEIERWRRTRSPAWLIAAAQQVRPDSADWNDVLAALRNVPASSPAYATARSQAAMMLTLSNQKVEAVKVLDEVLDSPASATLDLSSINKFHEERMQVDGSFEEFLKDVPRKVAFTYEEDENDAQRAAEPKYLFDADAAFLFNQKLPLRLWQQAANSKALAANIRADIARAGWVRSVVSGSDSQQFAATLAALKPLYAGDLAGFSRLSESERTFAEVFWVLHHPELTLDVRAGLPRISKDGSIDPYRDNWWCGIGRQTIGPEYTNSLATPPFVKPPDAAEAEEEKAEVTHAGIAPAFLAREVVGWANAHRDDSRNPEALALAVKSARYSCTDEESVKYSERAFRLLHTRYPNSDWTKRTPYWFK